MQRTSKLTVALVTLVLAFSLIGHVWGISDGYEPVGGGLSQTSYITTFLVPILIIIGIFGALIIVGVIRIKFECDANESA